MAEGGWMTRWNAWVDRCLPTFDGDPDRRWRAHTFLGVTALFLASMPAFAVMHAAAGRWVPATTAMLALGFGPFAVWAIRRFQSVVVPAHAVGAFGTLGVLVTAHAVDGTDSQVVMWLGMLVLLVAIGGGARVGLFWTVAGLIGIWGLFAYDGTAEPSRPRVAQPLDGAISASIGALFAWLVAAVWESGRRASAAEAAQVAEKLRDAQRKALLTERLATIGTLATGVAHEINTPLTYVTLNLDQLAQHLNGGEEGVTLLAEARHGMARLRGIVGQIKTFARADEARVRSVAVRDTIDAALRMVGNQVRLTNRVEIDVEPALRVRANEARLAQVFVNLLQNATDALQGREGGVVMIRGDARGARIRIDVTDNGAGIPADVVGRVFDPFFTTKPVGQGTGLGLSICQGVVLDIGGTISVTSAVGVGTTFRLELPMDLGNSGGDSVPPPNRPDRGTHLRVLVIDDDPVLGRAMKRALRERHSLTVVHSAEDALVQLDGGASFDAIVCDLMMPGMPGWVFADRLGEVRPTLASRTLYVSGGAFTDDARQFVDRVQGQFLAKPYTARELADAIEQLCER